MTVSMEQQHSASDSPPSATSVDARNTEFAVQERIAYASCLPASIQLDYRDPANEHDNDLQHAALAAAKDRLHEFVLVRLRELQLLTHLPITGTLKTGSQLSQLLRAYPDATPWSVLGEHAVAALELPDLPDLLRKDLWGPTEVLLALAGQLGKEGPGGASGIKSNARGGVSLPRTLGLVTFLPTIQTLQPPALSWLRGFFADLRPQHRHVGVDDRHHVWFKELKLHASRSLLKQGSAPMCRAFLRFGAPHSARAALWECALCLAPLSQQDVASFAGLCSAVQAQRSLLDICICDDLGSIADSEHFFLFEEMLRAVLLALSRNWELPLNTPVDLQPSIVAVASALSGQAGNGDFASADGGAAGPPTPPCSVLLPQGAALLAAPLCYMLEHPAAVYRLFKSMYTRYWCKLYSLQPLGGSSPALPMLVKVYEQVLQELDPDVVSHIHTRGLPIAALAVPWITSAFSGHLPVEELLLLWDRVLGLDSLLPVPLLAVAVVCFRRQAILACQSSSEVLEVVADLSQLQTVPLLQAVLFAG